MDTEERLCLGAIVGVHGIRGEVKVKSFTDIVEDIDQYGALEDKSGSKKFIIKVTGYSKGILRVKIKGVDDRNTSESLIGTQLFVAKNLLPDLGEDEFYHADLIGLDVKLKSTNEVAGKILNVYNFGAGDVLEIENIRSKNSEMIPFNKEYVPVVNVKEGYIIVESIELNFAPDEEAQEEMSDDEG